jgi:hypothetical protein
MELVLSGNHLIQMAAHHSYTESLCPTCGLSRTTRKDLVTKALKEGRELLCRSCAIKACDTRWDSRRKDPQDLVKHQGAYKSFCKAKRRVKTNHHGAYATVEFRFESYEQFLAELGPRPEGMTLDRIDPMGHYEPGNVRWATRDQQAKNRNPRFTWTPQKTASRDAKIGTK